MAIPQQKLCFSIGLTYRFKLRNNICMKRERNISILDRQRFSAALIRTAAVRATLIATVFGLTGHAIAGDHDKTVVCPAPTEARIPTAKRIKHWFQTGQASWYGLKFQGRRTATGESFDMNALTCAHPSLPLGSWVRVTNLRNRKTVVVRVNDRGPSVSERIVDLSYAAARIVGLSGTGKVKLEPVPAPEPEGPRVLLAKATDPMIPRLAPLGPLWAPAR
jgi:rare lipoprotein A